MEVGQKIKLVRLHRGLTQKQLGDLAHDLEQHLTEAQRQELSRKIDALSAEVSQVQEVVAGQ